MSAPPPHLPRPLRVALRPGETMLWHGRPRISGDGGLAARQRALWVVLAGLAAVTAGLILLAIIADAPGAPRRLPGIVIAFGALVFGLGLWLSVRAHMRRGPKSRTAYMLSDRAAYRFVAGTGGAVAAWEVTQPLIIAEGAEWSVLFDHSPGAAPGTVAGVGFENLAPDPALLAALERWGVTGPADLRRAAPDLDQRPQ